MPQKSKWVIVEERYEYAIQWWNADDSDLGCYFGDGGNRYTRPGETSDDTWAIGHDNAFDSVKSLELGSLGSMGFRFQTRGEAKKALGILNACTEAAESEKPWPAWAIEAKAAGWKAPKGWKP